MLISFTSTTFTHVPPPLPPFFVLFLFLPLEDCPRAYYLQHSTACIYQRKRNTTQKRYYVVALLCIIRGVVPDDGDAADSTWSHATVCSKFYVCLRTRLPVCGVISQFHSHHTKRREREKEQVKKKDAFAVTLSSRVSAKKKKRAIQWPSAYCCLSACCYDGTSAEPGCELRSSAAVACASIFLRCFRHAR